LGVKPTKPAQDTVTIPYPMQRKQRKIISNLLLSHINILELCKLTVDYLTWWPDNGICIAIATGKDVIYLLDDSKKVYVCDLRNGIIDVDPEGVSVIVKHIHGLAFMTAKSNQTMWNMNKRESYPPYMHRALTKVNWFF
jgi:hypothetical protein